MKIIDDYRDAQRAVEKAKSDLRMASNSLRTKVEFIYKAYATEKTKVSTRNWPTYLYSAELGFKVKSKVIKVKVSKHIKYGAYATYEWEFPIHWLKFDTEKLNIKIAKMLAAEKRDLDRREKRRLERRKEFLRNQISNAEMELMYEN